MKWLEYYAAMVVLTGLYVGFDMPSAHRPKGLGEWLAFAGIAICWPAAFVYAVYWAIKQRGGL